MTALVSQTGYNSLPSLDEASVSRQAPSVEAIINGPIRDVFLKHAADTVFCLYLVHRHHSVKADETIVKVEGTAHVMNSQVIEGIVSIGNKIVPTTWMTSGGQVLPMEYAAVPAGAVTSVPKDAFLSEFVSILKSNECDSLFGIDTLAKNDWSEMTIGDASVVVPTSNSDSYNREKFIPVAFAFDKENPKFRVHGRCQKDQKHSSKPPK